MNLRKRLFWLYAPLLLLALVIVLALSQRILLGSFDAQDDVRLQEQARSVDTLINDLLANQLELLQSLALWDDARQYALQPRTDFVRSNLDESSLESLGFDFLLVFDRHNKLLNKTWIQRRSVAANPLTAAEQQRLLERMIDQLKAFDHRRGAAYGMARLLSFNDIPLILVTSPISNNEATQGVAGTMIGGRFLDSHRLRKLQAQAGSALQLGPIANLPDTWQPLPEAQPSGIRTLLSPRQLINDQQQRISLGYPGLQGDPALELQVSLPRTLYQQGRKSIQFFLIAAALVVLIAILLGYATLEHWILRRLLRMHREVSRIGHDTHIPHLSDAGSDELGQLASELNQMLERLKQSEDRDKAILDSINEGYFELDIRGRILAVNHALETLLGYPREQMLKRSIQDFHSPQEVERMHDDIVTALEEQRSLLQLQLRRSNGSLGHFEMSISPIEDADDVLVGYRGLLRDISEQVLLQNQLLDMAYQDPLTGLNNRQAFDEQLQLSLQQEPPAPGLSHVLLYIDLDRFKEVNDRFGHDCGDALLNSIAERMRKSIRTTDRGHLYRLGGDEFCVLLLQTDQQAALSLAQRLLGSLGEPFELNGLQLDFVTPSIGIALFPQDARTPAELVKAADTAMYRAKQQRNCASLFQSATLP